MVARSRRTWIWRILAPLALAIPASWAGAQATLPDELIARGPNGPGDLQTIADFVRFNVGKFQEDAPAEWARAKSRLLAPFDRPQVAVHFRASYSEALVPELQRLRSSEREGVARMALYIAGELATEQAVMLVESALNDPDPVDRYAAVYALSRTLRALDRSAPALQAASVTELINRLATNFASEQDPLVADMYVRALLEGARIDREGLESVGHAAMKAACRAMGLRLRELPASEWASPIVGSILWGMIEIQNMLLRDFNKTIPDDVVREAAGLAGDAVATASWLAQRGELPRATANDSPQTAQSKRDARARWVDLMAAADRLLDLAQSRIAPGNPVQALGLAAALGQATPEGDRAFFTTVAPRAIARPSGLLVNPPFAFAADRFTRRP